MALDLTPLDESKLTDGVKRVLAAGPMQMMAARGLAPLPPKEMITALYQLAQPWTLEGEDHPPLPSTAVDARKTSGTLPDGILAGVLGQPLDPRILEFFARKLTARGELLQSVLFNRAVADETFAHLASVCAEPELAIIARNEERLLRHTPIIAALYLNPKTPMSVALRAVELAVRNGQVVDIPEFEGIKESVQGEQAKRVASGDEDEVFRQAVAEGADYVPEPYKDEAIDTDFDAAMNETDEKKKNLKISELSIPGKIRLAMVGNAFARSILVRDSNRPVAMAAITSPQVGDNEVLKYAANRALSSDVVSYIARQRGFTRLYGVKFALVLNPKTPLPTSMNFLNFLTVRDLRSVAKSKSISSPLVKAAAGLLQKKVK